MNSHQGDYNNGQLSNPTRDENVPLLYSSPDEYPSGPRAGLKPGGHHYHYHQKFRKIEDGRNQHRMHFTRLPNYQSLIPLIDTHRDEAEVVELFTTGSLVTWNRALELTTETPLGNFNDPSGEYSEWGLTRIQITNQDAAFVLGKAGRTKRKLMKVSNCFLNLTPELVLEVAGLLSNRAMAVMLIQLIIQQRINNRVTLEIETETSGTPPSTTIVNLPKSCISFVTGQHGTVIRNVERDLDIVMFFAETGGCDDAPVESADKTVTEDLSDPVIKCEVVVCDGGEELQDEVDRKDPTMERELQRVGEGEETTDTDLQMLVIFGYEQDRKGAELKMMSAVEQKTPGYYTNNVVEAISEAVGFETDTIKIPEDDFSYALGKEGNTRRKLAVAAGCVLEYIGHWAFIAGVQSERKRGREYLKWLLQQRKGSVKVDPTGRDDVMTLVAPVEILRSTFGPRGIGRQLERETNTFCFINDRGNEVDDYSTLLIFSCKLAARLAMKDKLLEALHDRFISYQYHKQVVPHLPMMHDTRLPIDYMNMSPPNRMHVGHPAYMPGRDRSPQMRRPANLPMDDGSNGMYHDFHYPMENENLYSMSPRGYGACMPRGDYMGRRHPSAGMPCERDYEEEHRSNRGVMHMTDRYGSQYVPPVDYFPNRETVNETKRAAFFNNRGGARKPNNGSPSIRGRYNETASKSDFWGTL